MIPLRKKLSGLLKDNKFVFLSNIIERLFFFLFFLIVANSFKPETYGQLVTIFSLSNILAIVFDLGLPFYIQREFSFKGKNKSEIFSAIVLICLFAAPLYFVSGLVMRQILYPDINLVLVSVILVMVYFFYLANIFSKSLSGLSQFKAQFIALSYSRLISMILIILCVLFLKPGITMLLLLILAGAGLQLSLLKSAVNKCGVRFIFSKVNFMKLIGQVKVSLPLGLSVIFYFLYDKIDVLLISKFTGYKDVAFYGAGYGVYKAAAIMFSFLFTTGLTEISYLGRNRKAVSLFFRKYTFILLTISVPLSIVLFAASQLIIDLLYVPDLDYAGTVLKILSAAVPGAALCGLAGLVLNGLGMFKENMLMTLSGLLLNFILNFIFIKKYGMISAAYITVITEYFLFAAYMIFVLKYLKG